MSGPTLLSVQQISWLESKWNSIEALFDYDEFNIKVWGTIIVSIMAYWSLGTAFTFVDVTGRPKFMDKYKVQENVKSYPISIGQLFELIKVVGLNQLFTTPLIICMYYFDKWRGFELKNTPFPNLYTLITHLLAYLIIVEIGFYYSHRLLHNPYFYKRIHKKHHTWISPVAISAAYCHPIEHIVSNITPALLGPIIMRSHISLLWLWIVLATFETLSVHSGYHLPFLQSPEFHDFHHLKFNYNFGVIGLMDYLHGTDQLFRKSKQFVRHQRVWTTKPIKELIP